ncbi:MgtC/SapB family protein [Peptoniphilus catoniae]|uniref:MgtC/SapB family protein n=1 Tax=Peptoniphilus catoniae TaxID=1660341 RepID=UPI0010FD446A|nr:MgtC/SapB family protein [Peptoniphilus catoniae]
MKDFLNLNSFTLNLTIRIILACVCGFAIGSERKIRHKNAGIRTHMIVAMGSCLAMIISKYGFFDSLGHDPGRIAAQVVSGIGFLGAGLIFVRNIDIQGLTTAAGVWTTSIVAMAIGAGLIFLGIFATILILLIQTYVYKFFESKDHELYKILIFSNDYKFVPDLKAYMDSLKIYREGFIVSHNRNELKIVVKCSIDTEEQKDEFINYLINNKSIIKFYFI